MIKESKGRIVFNIFNILILSLLAIVTIYPFLHVLFASFSDPIKFASYNGIMLKPVGFSLEGYKAVLERKDIYTGYANTLFYVVAGTGINMIFTVSLAYALSRQNLYWGKFLMIMVIITMYFGGGLIPTYLLVRGMGLTNTRWAIILPSAISTFNLIIMKSAFETIPVSLEEAAKIDGASPYTIMYKIILPLSLPTIAVIVLYYAVAHWNSWFSAMIYLRKQELYPLQLVLRAILRGNDTGGMLINTQSADKQALNEILKYSTIIVSIVPILILYPFLQKYFTKGVMIGAVKG